MWRSNNLAARVLERQIVSARPGSQVNLTRHLYENLCPSHTAADLDAPDLSFRKFTDDGLFLLAFSRNLQDLVVYRPAWLAYSCRAYSCCCDSHDQAHAIQDERHRRFDSFFRLLYSLPLAASASEFICKDFFLYVHPFRFGLFATSTPPVSDPSSSSSTSSSSSSSSPHAAVPGVPSADKITFYLVRSGHSQALNSTLSLITHLLTSYLLQIKKITRLDDGVVLDEKAFLNDFINLAHCAGAFLYDDLLCIVSLRYQTIHILQIRDSGNLVEVRKIGAFCQEDDELFLHSHAHAQVPSYLMIHVVVTHSSPHNRKPYKPILFFF